MLVVEAKGKKGMAARQFQRSPPPPLPKIEDDGNPRFVIFIRMANVCFFSLLKKVQFSIFSVFFFFLSWILEVTVLLCYCVLAN